MTHASPHLAEHRDDAIQFAFERFSERHPGVVADWTARQRARCREDLAFHWEALEAAVEVGEPDHFARYLQWAGAVLTSRGVPEEHLREVLASFEAYVRRSLTGEQGEAAMRALGGSGGQGPPAVASMDLGSSPVDPPARIETKPLMRMLLEGDAAGAWGTVRALLDSDGYEDVAVGAVQPALYQVGRLWQRHEISVAQEHLATAQASLLLTHAFTTVPMARPHERRALFAAVEGNRHALGSRMLGDVFALRGWRVQELGADVPIRDLIGQVDRFEPQVVGLSAALPQHVAAVRDAFTRIRADFGARRPILLAGGLPFNQVEGLAERVGADAWHPDARRAGADAV